ncbi:MAG TPA: HdeD family acid-resistance protein [Terriglobales bacterium]|jgi:uncharacterized membrane protein HdeD (DUF308 family)|nr:HdeD family acid-resistance protein [Terriglobales bacterium]
MEMISRMWWAVLLRGIFGVLFALIAFFWPGITIVALVLLFGAYALADGIFALITAIRVNWLSLFLEGIVGIAVGILTFIWPGITAIVLLYFIAAWAVITGVFEIIAAIRLRRTIENEWLLVLGGLVSVLLGILLFAFPKEGALSVIWVIAVFAFIFGILLIAFAFKLRGLITSKAS